jgi:phospholipase D1/2
MSAGVPPSAMDRTFGEDGAADLPATFLHGKLDIYVIEARKVEGSKASRNLFKRVERAVTASLDGVDPYCTVKLGYNKILQTPVVQNNSSPEWNTFASFDVAHAIDALEFRVKAAKRGGPLAVISKVQHLSLLALPAADIIARRSIDEWFPLTSYVAEKTAEHVDTESEDDSGHKKPRKVGAFGEIHIKILYTPVQDIIYTTEVPDTYFPVRHGCHVQLYQDADVPPGTLPPVPFMPENEPGRCYRDMALAISGATDFIYITGWAVWTELVLVRTEYPGDEDCLPQPKMTLGELLKFKAEQGVTVCVMVWDERASGSYLGVESAGLMGTHDEETTNYFKGSKVHSTKVGRVNAKDGPLADLNDSLLYTHHQKTVICATRDYSTGGKSRLRAFVGGLDLTNGRYDNPHHALFRTLKTLHAPPDFWQACNPALSETSGPREGWHDIHSSVSGVAAWDVLANFEGRWKRQAPNEFQDKLHPRPAEFFVTPTEENDIRNGSWSVQVLRSITEASAVLDSKRPGLSVGRNALIDQSIHHSYVHHIRGAKSFVVIDNQYFLGSSHLWNSGQRGGFASNLIPVEIAEKICTKIRANERFAVYVTVPLFPEGESSSGAVQEILSHQRKTVALITSRVAAALKEVGSDAEITDYFNMFCLVQRESPEGGQSGDLTNPTQELIAGQTRRFMVYNHAKYACFDDTAAIVGSANINSRSMAGNRDTEIANLMWQPDHVATGSTGYPSSIGQPTYLPRGNVAVFRRNVWSEFLGGLYPEFEDPGSVECVRKVRELAGASWDHFAGDGPPSDMPHGIQALYPYAFDSDGTVTTTVDVFPDCNDAALVKGKASGIPNMLTG